MKALMSPGKTKMTVLCSFPVLLSRSPVLTLKSGLVVEVE